MDREQARTLLASSRRFQVARGKVLVRDIDLLAEIEALRDRKAAIRVAPIRAGSERALLGVGTVRGAAPL